MSISFPAPALCQQGDEDLLVEIGDIVYPGFVKRPLNENGLRLWVEGGPTDPRSKELVTAMFQALLGALRAFRAEAGELRDEQLAGLGTGSARDEAGNQWVEVGTVRVFATIGGEVRAFATDVRAAIATSQALLNALWLNGRLGRTAADYYMIHEYAQGELGGTKGVRDALGISDNAQKKLTASANNLSPLRRPSRERTRVGVMESRGTAGPHGQAAHAMDQLPRVVACDACPGVLGWVGILALVAFLLALPAGLLSRPAEVQEWASSQAA